MTASTTSQRILAWAAAFAAASTAAPAAAAILDGTNQCTVKLADGSDVVLYGEYVSPMGTRAPSLAGLPFSAPLLSQNFGRAIAPDTLEFYDAISPAKKKKKNKKKKPADDDPIARARELRKGWRQPTFKEHEKSNNYYYLPPNSALRLAFRPDGETPEFLFVRYTTDDKLSEGGTQGGILHFLMEWRLTNEQESQLRSLVSKQCRAGGGPGKLMGPVELTEVGGDHAFAIRSATLGSAEFTKALVQSGHAPTMPGGKVVAAANLNAHGAQLFHEIAEKSKSISDLSIELTLGYAVQLPAARGEIVFHWDRLRELEHHSEATFEYTQRGVDGELPEGVTSRDWLEDAGKAMDDFGKGASKAAEDFGKMVGGAVEATGQGLADLGQGVVDVVSAPFDAAGEAIDDTFNDDRTFTQDEAEEIFDAMVEQSIVEFYFEDLQPNDELGQQAMQAMMQFFTDSLMQPAPDLELPETESVKFTAPEGIDAPGLVDTTRKYSMNYDAVRSAVAAKKQIVRLNAGLAVPRKFTLVGNMAGWYDGVKSSDCCVFDVNLSDPFFEHRDIRFVVDLDAKEVFEEMVNHVTVNVRKRRAGDDFERSLTIDRAYLEENGVAASLSYARQNDRDSGVYEFQSQWSLRGGNLWPPNPRWTRGSWEGVTLDVPIERWYVEAEGDLDQMTAHDIARVTVELHYRLFGKEEHELLALSPRQGDWMVGKHIFVDRGTKGFAYRLIVHHKTEGRMVLPWTTRVGDRYVYATIPDEVLQAGVAQQQAKELAQKLGQLGAEKILDKFSDLLGSGG